jgi:pentatricopeptide repeat protein
MKEASRIFSEMRESGLVPDVITYNTFVASYAADSMFEDAIDVVRYMIKHGCKPNQNTYNSVVDGYCKHNHRDDAIMFISSLHELDPHISREEKCRLSERLTKWS